MDVDQKKQPKRKKEKKRTYSRKLVSQTLDQCEELQIKAENIIQVNKLKQIRYYKAEINKGLDLSANERRKHFKTLIKRTDTAHFYGEIYFYIANDFEVAQNYKKAIQYYKRSIDENKNRNYYISTKTVNHLYHCKKVLINAGDKSTKIGYDLVELLENSWKNSASNEDQYQKIRRYWVIYGDVREQLLGAAECSIHLARLHEDRKNENVRDYNDKSLVWYKRALNILEKLKVIIICTVGINDMVDSSNVKRPIINKNKCDKHVERKRILVTARYKEVKAAESVAQSYMQCLVERFIDKKYTKNIPQIQMYPCFKDFHGNKNKYNSDFMKYLRIELDSLFEMNHSHF
eukprot:293380_1